MSPHTSFNLKTAAIAGMALLAFGAAVGYAANKFGKPKTVIHVVTLYFKDGTTEEQKKAVFAAVEKMAPNCRVSRMYGSRVQSPGLIHGETDRQ